MDIGQGIKKLRKEFKLNQNTFAKKVGISQTYVSDLENNRKNPTLNTMENILKPFDIKYVDFLIKYCDYKRVPNDPLAEQRYIAGNDKDQHFFSSLVDISEIKGFEFDGEPLNDKEQTALLSLIELIMSNKE